MYNALDALRPELLALQRRLSRSVSRVDGLRSYEVLVSVAVSDFSGNSVHTTEPYEKTRPSGLISGQEPSGLFANGYSLDSAEGRSAAMFEVAARFYGLLNNPTLVVNATFQIDANGSKTNLVAQCYRNPEDGRLVIREVVQ